MGMKTVRNLRLWGKIKVRHQNFSFFLRTYWENLLLFIDLKYPRKKYRKNIEPFEEKKNDKNDKFFRFLKFR